jgi:hypothetical protein
MGREGSSVMHVLGVPWLETVWLIYLETFRLEVQHSPPSGYILSTCPRRHSSGWCFSPRPVLRRLPRMARAATEPYRAYPVIRRATEVPWVLAMSRARRSSMQVVCTEIGPAETAGTEVQRGYHDRALEVTYGVVLGENSHLPALAITDRAPSLRRSPCDIIPMSAHGRKLSARHDCEMFRAEIENFV